MFSDRVAHSRFHHLLPIPTVWLTCVCPGPGEAGRAWQRELGLILSFR
jgi:hypothetical protein